MSFPYFNHFLELFYPRLCLACTDAVPPKSELFCLQCQFKLPKTNLHLTKENALTERFWGRLPLVSGAALYYFIKGGRTQQLIHNLKYTGKRQIGLEVGKWYAEELKEVAWFQSVDLIVPVPLHPKKERLRGYNQSDYFAQGLSEGLKRPTLKTGLKRLSFTSTQTKKSKLDRFENVLRAFAVSNPEHLKGKHILLVDDVITTGATLEACGLRILEVPDTKLSILSIALADH